MKNIAAALLALVMLITLVPRVSAEDEIYFTAVNDVLNTLSADTMPVYLYGGYYVPSSVFNNSTLLVNQQYDRAAQTLLMYKDDLSVLFNIADGKAVDNNDYVFNAHVIYRNSRTYVPLAFVCGIFGFSYSVINAKPGKLIRIKNENVYLEDDIFANAATSLMQLRLNEYLASIAPVPENPVTPPQDDPPNPVTPPRPPSIENVATTVFVLGLSEETDRVLDMLAADSQKVTFFVSADDIRSYPDAVRRIAGLGHTLGIFCEASLAEYAQGAALLKKSARRATIMTSCPEEDEEKARRAGLIPVSVPEVTALENSYQTEEIFKEKTQNGACVITLDGREDAENSMRLALQWCRLNSYTISAVRETDAARNGA
ncbi:MAG: hypothetical protein II784_00825 [Oscillospiraceae bacterium]|nr:hypothetical protein [Oscillospiraceae bacterium]